MWRDRPGRAISPWRALVVVALVMLATGCVSVPRDKFTALAETSDSIVTGTQKTYGAASSLQNRYIVFTVETPGLGRESFAPVRAGLDVDLAGELEFRQKILAQLDTYVDALKDLAVEDFGTGVDSASRKLSKSLASAAGITIPGRSGDRKADAERQLRQATGVLATIVNVLGRREVDRRRVSALKDIMDKMQPAVESWSSLLIESNELLAAAMTGMETAIFGRANRARVDATAADKLFVALAVVPALEDADSAKRGLVAINDALRAFPLAHDETRKTLHEPRLGVLLKNLVDEGKRIEKFYTAVTK